MLLSLPFELPLPPEPKRMFSRMVPVFNQGEFGTWIIWSFNWKTPLIFLISPDSAEISVDLPLAIAPTMPTNSDFCNFTSFFPRKK